MSAWTPTSRRVGLWSSWAVFVLSLVYLATGIAWLVFGGEAARGDPLAPVDPFLAALEFVIVLLAPPMITLFG